MYHRICPQTQKQLRLVILAGLIALPIPLSFGAGAEPQCASAASPAADYPLAENVKEIKREPNAIEFYAFDRIPLGSRRPLLFVHGLRGELWKDCFRWQKLATFLTGQSEFSSHYKIYFARYNSYLPLNTVTDDFRRSLIGFYNSTGANPISIVALSMGGNIVAEALADAKTDACVAGVLTLGTPFHGSPLFTPSWMQYSMMKSHITPFTQLDTCLPYDIYFSKHTNLLSDLNWDNSDGMVPSVSPYRLWFRPKSAIEVSAAVSANSQVLAFNRAAKVNKSKFTVYGGYLSTEIALSGSNAALSQVFKAPHWFVATVIPEHMGKEHAVLRSLNRQMTHAFLPVAADGRFRYALNDGISPLESSLFLPNEAMSKAVVTRENEIRKLAGLVDVHRARAFRGIDHLTFIDAYRPHGGLSELKDQLAPDEGSRSIFDWVLTDLVRDGSTEALAVGPKEHRQEIDR